MKIINSFFAVLFTLVLSSYALNLKANEDFPPPFYLFANIEGNDVELSWGADGSDGAWLSYMTGNVSGGLGLATPGTYRAATRWPAESLTGFVNKPLAKFAFVPNGNFTQYTVKVWKGDNAETLIFSQQIQNVTVGEWNEFLFPGDVFIEEGEDYWFGLELDQLTEGDMSMTFDSGPAETGFGDLIHLGSGWVSTTAFGFNNNWAMRVFVINNGESEAVAMSGVPEQPLDQKNNELVSLPLQLFDITWSNKNNPIPTGFNIYRDDNLLNDEPVTNAVFLDNDVPNGIYLYGVTAVYAEGESIPVERTVQIGAPELIIEPGFINETLQGGEAFSETINLSNTGLSALEWEVNELPTWITLSATSGSIEPGQTQNIQLNVLTSGLGMGTYNYNVLFNTNNFNNNVSPLPVNIVIESEMILAWTTDTLDFGNIAVSHKKLMNVGLSNMANYPVYLFTFTATLPNTLIFNPTWVVQPGETMDILVSFEPEEAIEYLGNIEVQYFHAFGSGTFKLPYKAKGTIMHPSNLTATLVDNMVTLNWLPPGASDNELRFGSGIPYSAVGTSAGLYEFAARFTADDLMPYTDKQLEKVSFFIFNDAADFTVNVYTDSSAQQPLYSIPVVPVAGEWNEVTLPVPLPLATVDNLWLTYTTSQTTVEFIAGVDGGPAVTGSGDLLRMNGLEWTTLSSYGINKNWNIKGVISEIDTGEDKNFFAGDTGFPGADKSMPGLLGYNVFRNDVQLNEELLTTLSFTDEIDEDQLYVYGVTAVYTYGESEPATISVSMPAAMSLPDGWEFNPTSFSHNIHIPADVMQIGMNLSHGDLLGAFYTDSNGNLKAAGAIQWQGEHAVLTVFGNDPATESKDGFDYDEPITWKVYLHQSGTTANLTATYNQEMPHNDGAFRMLGLSMVEALQMTAVNVDEVAGESVVIYPNPFTNFIEVAGIDSAERIVITDITGRVLISRPLDNTRLDTSMLPQGVYVIFLESNGSRNHIQKMIKK